jgi:hypothetical protein
MISAKKNKTKQNKNKNKIRLGANFRRPAALRLLAFCIQESAINHLSASTTIDKGIDAINLPPNIESKHRLFYF